MKRLFIIMETTDDFSFEVKAKADVEKCKSAGVGNADVEISASITSSKTGKRNGC